MKKQIKDVITKEFKGLWGTDFSDDGIPVIKTNNMSYEGRIDYSDICIRNITSEEAEGNFLCNGDLIIEKSGGTKTHSVGYVNIFEGEDNKYVCNNFILPIRPNRDLVNPKYLFWQLHGMYEAGRFSDCFNKTTGIQNLQKKTYFSKEINVPSLPEQQKIAAHLDSIQSAIDNKKQQLKQLDELVKSKFVEMFGNPGINENNFGIVSITELSQNLDSIRKPVTAKDRTEGEFPYYGASGIVDYVSDYLFDEDILLISEDGANLIARSTPIAFSVKGKVWVNNHAHVLSFKNFETQIFVEFYFSLFDISSFVTGAAQPKLSQNKLNEIPIFNPPIELQNTFAEFVQKIDSAKSIIKTQLVDLQELLDSKMDEYFGE